MSAFEFPFAVGKAVKKEDMIGQIQVITFIEERINAGRDALSAVENRMDAQNTLTSTARPARKPKKSWKNESRCSPYSPQAAAA